MVGPPEERSPVSSINLQHVLGSLLRYWWLPVITLALGLGAGVGLVRLTAPTYVSKARMWETLKVRLPEGSLFSDDVQNAFGTQTELLQSDALRLLTLARLQSTGGKQAIPVEPDGSLPLVTIRVTSSGKSSVFVIEATSSHAAYTQAYLNALMDVFLEYKRNMRQQLSGLTLASISEEVKKAEDDLNEAKQLLMVFEQTNNLAGLQQDSAVSGGYLAGLKTKLSDLQLEERLLQASALERETNGSDTNGVAAAWVDPASTAFSAAVATTAAEHQAALRALDDLKLQRAKLSRNLRPKHPKIVKLDADIERARRMLETFRRQDQDQLAASRQAIQLRLANTQDAIQQWERKVERANAIIARAEGFKFNVQQRQIVYDRLMVLLQNVGLSRNIDQETLAILEPASPAKRSHAQETSLLALSGAGGFALGLGIIGLLGVRDDRFTSLAEVAEKLGQNVLGQVPEIPRLRRGEVVPLLAADDKRHLYAESYRNLRSAILFMPIEGERPKSVLITSAVPNEGKSTIAANLSRALALGGARVVLVDADMRRGVLHQLLGLRREPGLSQLIQQPDKLDDILQKDTLLHFSFISSGTISSNSGDLFLGSAFDDVLAGLRQQFDHIIIDSSPVFAADDATTLAPKVDGTLFVVRSRFSSARPVREALELLYQRQAKVLGIVFNQADPSARSYYYYKYADYYRVAVPSEAKPG